MVVARKPPSPTKPVINEDEAMRFINGASGDPPLAPAAVAVAVETSAPKPKRTPTAKKEFEPVLVRFEPDVITAIDDRAGKLGVSRSAYLRMVIARDLGLAD